MAKFLPKQIQRLRCPNKVYLPFLAQKINLGILVFTSSLKCHSNLMMHPTFDLIIALALVFLLLCFMYVACIPSELNIAHCVNSGGD